MKLTEYIARLLGREKKDDMETWLIAGLGNPGVAYEHSRHNAGFKALDALADKTGIAVTKKGMNGLWGDGIAGGKRLILVKPQTYMNLSGDCVQKVMHFFKIPPERVIIIYDDIAIPLGTMRIRANGSAGTHNGMRSVVACLGCEDFPRIRVGVGEERKGELKDFVLGKPGKQELALMEEVCKDAGEAALLIVEGRINDAQARYNKKHTGLG